jgi:hypothetical protein
MQWCLMDVGTVNGGYGRWLISRHVPGYPTEKVKEMAGKNFQRGGKSASYFLFACLGS